MITIFTTPKAFIGHAGLIQDNAIGSWTRLSPACEVILFGNDPGVAEAVARHGVRHEPAVALSARGAPLISDMFARADKIARYPTLAFVNTDIILFDDFTAAVERVSRASPRFMAISARFDFRIEKPLAFEPGWADKLHREARRANRMYPAAGTDIFVYPRGLLGPIPPFVIGRGYWDNWLMYRARALGADLVDVTPVVTALHQDHDYTHVGGVSPASGEKVVYASAEGRSNLELAGGLKNIYTVYDATHVLLPDGRLHSTLKPFLIRRRAKSIVRRGASRISPTLLSRLGLSRAKG